MCKTQINIIEPPVVDVLALNSDYNSSIIHLRTYPCFTEENWPMLYDQMRQYLRPSLGIREGFPMINRGGSGISLSLLIYIKDAYSLSKESFKDLASDPNTWFTENSVNLRVSSKKIYEDHN